MQLEKELKKYFKDTKRLEANGGVERNTDLFEELLWQEQQILAHFGLPISDKYRKLLWELTAPDTFQKKKMQDIIAKLQQAAETHLLSPVHTAAEVLRQAQQEQLNPFDVLPELGYITHTYTLYLYEQLLLNEEASPEAILQELEKTKELDCLGDIAYMSYKTNPRRTKTYRQLKGQLQFLDAYLDHLLYGEQEEEELADETEVPAPTPYLIKYPLVIERIVCIDQTNISMVVKVQKYNSKESLTVGLQLEDFETLMLLYHPLGAEILNHTSRLSEANKFDELTYEVDLEEDFGETLLIDKHYFEVFSPQIRDASGRLEENSFGFVMLNEILPATEQTDTEQKENALEELNGYLKHIQAAYGTYKQKLDVLNATSSPLSREEKELVARNNAGLQDERLFEIGRMLYELHNTHRTDFEVRGK